VSPDGRILMDLSALLRLLAVLLLVAANAFFVAAEFSLVQARRRRTEELTGVGDRLARAVDRAQRDLDRAISGTQLGITLASLALGWIGEPAVARLVEAGFVALAVQASPAVVHGISIFIAFSLIAYLHVVFGELLPKTVALNQPERVSRIVSLPLLGFHRLLSPAIWLLNRSSDFVLRAFGLRTATAKERVHSPEEIELFVQQSHAEGVVEEDEQAMIHGVFELTRTVAREVMTPRTDIVAVEADSTLDEAIRAAAESGFSRLPVYEDTIDSIIGVLLVKDLLPWLVRREGEGTKSRKLVRDAVFVPDTKPVDDLLSELRHQKVHMAIVVDEFGGTDGIVTLEDVLEEIVGEIYDEHDVAVSGIAIDPDGRILVDGGHSFSDLLEQLGLEAEEGEYDTVAGYAINALGRIPEVGQRVPLGTGELEVLELIDRRVTRLEVRPGDAESEVGGGEGSSPDPGEGTGHEGIEP
jgi:CBS domain containing-hemolysin-like protein